MKRFPKNSRRVVSAGVVAAIVVAGAQARGQGIPVVDTSNLAQSVEQVQAALRDAENQISQIEELRRQVELQIRSITNLEGILGSVSGLNEISDLYNSVTDLRNRAAKIADLDGFRRSVALGDWDGLLDHLLDGDVTMGEKRAAEAMKETLENAGFTAERLAALNAPGNPQGAAIADTAAANATAIGSARIAYEEAGQSIERVDGLVAEIARQTTLKESMDLNTRMVAEGNHMMGQMLRLEAASGMAAGANGVAVAADMARQRAFFDFSGDR